MKYLSFPMESIKLVLISEHPYNITTDSINVSSDMWHGERIRCGERIITKGNMKLLFHCGG